MRILFLSHYFPPEVNAPASRTFEHCVHWARAGHDVTVVTCAPNCPEGVVFDGYRNSLRSQREVVDGVNVIRVWTHLAPNAGAVRRILSFLSYMVSAVLVGIRLPRADVVVATSPQFFCGWAGVLVSNLRRTPFVLEIRDIWPESIAAVGALRSRWLLRFLEWLERRMYLAADRIVAVGDGYRQKILEKAAVADRIDVITNGVDLEQFAPAPPDERFLHQWDLEDKFVCSYIGTIGMAHGLDVVNRAAALLRGRGRDDIVFCLVGDGAERRRLEEDARQTGLAGRVVFTGMLPKEDMPRVLASSNACLIHLRGCELFGTVIPSKLFETMAMSRPIILGVRGEAQEIVDRASAGVIMQPDSAESLAQCVEQLADQPALTAELGRSARDFVAQRYSRDALAATMLTVLAQAAGVPGSRTDRQTSVDRQAEPAGRLEAEVVSSP